MVIKINKRGQIALWVVLGIVIFAVIIISLFFARNVVIPAERIESPENFIKSCVKDAVLESQDLIFLHGGFVNPENYKTYQNIKMSYLCENTEYFKPCINQHPLLISEVEEDMLNFVKPRLDLCLENFKAEAEKRNEIFDFGNQEINLTFASGKIFFDIDGDFKVKKNEESINLKKISFYFESPLYDTLKIAQEIVNDEAKYCAFEYVGYMILYNRWDISKNALSDSTKIYKIKDKFSEKEFNFAIRGCAIPPGI